MSFSVGVLLFVIGSVFGSFLNVVSLRYAPDKRFFFSTSVGGRSRCNQCGKTLLWYELFPILSFIVQRARCRGCDGKLLWQYPLVELATGLLFVFVPLSLSHSLIFLTFPSWLFWFSSGLWIIVGMALTLVYLVDRKHFLIPNGLNASIFILGAIWVLVAQFTGLFDGVTGGSFLGSFSALFPLFDLVFLNHIIGSIGAALLFFCIIFFSGGRAMGVGDLKLIAGLGLLFGWPDIGLIIFLSFVIGAAVSIVYMVRGRTKLSDVVPFGPFIVVAAAIVFFFGVGLLRGYFGILGM